MTDLDLLALRRHARRLLAPWEGGGPGATLGLVRGGALALHESAGLASLEHGIPIGPETRFRIASVSKQFTCAAILLLAAEGRLAVGDPIHRHLPELPDFGAPITIDHLMHNTSGLRDMLELMRLGGADLSQPWAAADLLAAIGRQRSLNFPPGSRFRYSNTGFLLLGRIVEVVGGMLLAEFLEARIFAPLGMTRTRHTPGTTEIVPHLATGYLPQEGGFVRAAHGFPLGGEGGLVSCVEDLALWERNYRQDLLPGIAAALQQTEAFANGTPNLYARGLEVTTYRGLRTVDHGGLWPGFKTCFLRVPERDLAIIAIANHGGIDVHHLAHQMLDMAAGPGLHPVPPMPKLEGLAGRWLDAESGATVEFSPGPAATQHGVPFPLAATADGRLAARRGVFPFTVAPPEGDTLVLETDAGTCTTFHRAPADPVLPAGLTGDWHCAELATTWTIAPSEAGLAVQVRGPLTVAGPWPIQPIAADVLRIRTPGTLFQGWLDAKLEGNTLVVSGARAGGLRFTRG
ncbi:serine hydrolase [Paeniroseomonas aquatica]|uniref:Serine hydrolase n=1 Tax=Paeniroseomonas aquatica TaxID=373043 RepID=A0ABT8A592_9PROT|nr:serine hydrolase [Paeniroseomonas aquatica]MDN3564749.1 serine hydrolase [Paeniroseomonas aquatica]